MNWLQSLVEDIRRAASTTRDVDPSKLGLISVLYAEGRTANVRPLGPLVAIGRSDKCAICVEHDMLLASRHAWLRYDPALGCWFVADEGSQNGTFLIGKRIGEGWHPVPPGAPIQCGSTFLRLTYPPGSRAHELIGLKKEKPAPAPPPRQDALFDFVDAAPSISGRPGGGIHQGVPVSLSKVRWVGPDETVEVFGRKIRGGLFYTKEASQAVESDPPSVIPLRMDPDAAPADLAVGMRGEARTVFRSFAPAQRNAYLDWLDSSRLGRIDKGLLILHLSGIARWMGSAMAGQPQYLPAVAAELSRLRRLGADKRFADKLHALCLVAMDDRALLLDVLMNPDHSGRDVARDWLMAVHATSRELMDPGMAMLCTAADWMGSDHIPPSWIPEQVDFALSRPEMEPLKGGVQARTVTAKLRMSIHSIETRERVDWKPSEPKLEGRFDHPTTKRLMSAYQTAGFMLGSAAALVRWDRAAESPVVKLGLLPEAIVHRQDLAGLRSRASEGMKAGASLWDFAMLASHLGLEEPGMAVLKAASHGLERLDLALEPDPRRQGVNRKSMDHLVLVECPWQPHQPNHALIQGLGVLLAGFVDRPEAVIPAAEECLLRGIASASDCRRAAALALTHTQAPRLPSLSKKRLEPLADRADHAGLALVDAASRLGRTERDDIRRLEAVFGALGLDEKLIYQTLHGLASPSQERGGKGHTIRRERLEAVKADDPRAFLAEVLAEVEPVDEPIAERSGQGPLYQEAIQAAAGNGEGQMDPLAAFGLALSAKPSWTRGEAKALAQFHGLMLGGALSKLNDMGMDQLDDLVVEEEGDEVLVSQEYLVKLLA